MPRRPATKSSRTARASALPTPVHSAYSTPLSSAYPSTYTSEVEYDPDDDVSRIPIGALTLRLSGGVPAKQPHTKTTRKEHSKPFRFLDLPSELRLKVYGFHFDGVDRTVDLDPDNHRRIHQKLAILRTCRILYNEAGHFFYSTHTFRIFPTHSGRFFKTKKPLLARLNARQRGWITSLELRLGPGWGKPPRGWVVNPALGLADLTHVRKLTVFVECDPSDGIFNGFRRADGFYEGFSRRLLGDVLNELPLLDRVHFDAWPSVKKSGAMMRGLLELVAYHDRKICWGPERGWAGEPDADTQTSHALSAFVDGMGTNIAVLA